MPSVRAHPLAALPEVRPGDDLAALIAGAAEPGSLRDGTVVAIAHKVVSKAEGALVALADVSASPRALELAGTAARTHVRCR